MKVIFLAPLAAIRLLASLVVLILAFLIIQVDWTM